MLVLSQSVMSHISTRPRHTRSVGWARLPGSSHAAASLATKAQHPVELNGQSGVDPIHPDRCNACPLLSLLPPSPFKLVVEFMCLCRVSLPFKRFSLLNLCRVCSRHAVSLSLSLSLSVSCLPPFSLSFLPLFQTRC